MYVTLDLVQLGIDLLIAFYCWHPSFTSHQWEQLIDVDHFDEKNIQKFLNKKPPEFEEYLKMQSTQLKMTYLPRVQ